MAVLTFEGLSQYDAELKQFMQSKKQVLEFDVVSQPAQGQTSFPFPGNTETVYIAKSTNTMYRWDPLLDVAGGYTPIGSGGGGSGTEMTPATDNTAGTGGTVPAPPAGANVKYLRGDKTWSNPVTKSSIKTALSATQAATNKFLNQNGEWEIVDLQDEDLVHTTGDETINGVKLFTSSPVVGGDTNRYRYYNFSNGNTSYVAIRADAGDPVNIANAQLGFIEYSPKTTPDAEHTGFYEVYLLPTCSSGKVANSSYEILTTKNPVGINQGGTGASDATTARTNLGLGAAAVKAVATSISAASTSANLPTAAAVAAFVEGKGYLTVHQSLASCVKTTGNQSMSGVISVTNTTDSSSTSTGAVKISGGLGVAKNIYASKVWNGVWNDYAECRKGETIEGGYCLCECSDGLMRKTSKRLMAGCRLTSDTYGHCMGKTEYAQTPIAVAGRVLAYTYENRNKFKLGDAVCSGPDGKVSKMSRREIRKYPDRIIGIVSEIPEYEYWVAGSEANPEQVPVDGRIWIYVR